MGYIFEPLIVWNLEYEDYEDDDPPEQTAEEDVAVQLANKKSWEAYCASHNIKDK